jgi:non-ribosomal peptide synthetase component F
MLNAAFDRYCLEETIAALEERHEALRTTFVTVAGQPRQKIRETGSPRLKPEYTDWRDNEHWERDLQQLAKQEAGIRFDLERSPLVRIRVVELPQDRNVVLFVMHHIVTDGWSLEVLSREFQAMYAALSKDNACTVLPPLRIQYKDFVYWQNAQLVESGSEMKQYWTGKLAGKLPALELPADFARPATGEGPGRVCTSVLSQADSLCLEELGLHQKATQFMTILSCIKILLYRLTGERDIIVGTPVAGRLHHELENQIGLYLNTLALRDTIDGESSLEEVIGQVKTTALEAFDHQTYPFDHLVDDLPVVHRKGRNPLYSVGFTMQNQSDIHWDELQEPGIPRHAAEVNIAQWEVQAVTDVWFTAYEEDHRFTIQAIYNADLFREETIDDLLEDLQSVIRSCCANPRVRVNEIEMKGLRPRAARPLPLLIDLDL